jgi:hypothetical protein
MKELTTRKWRYAEPGASNEPSEYVRQYLRYYSQDKKVGYTYKSGMKAPQTAKKEKKADDAPKQCGFCFKFGHIRRAHHHCGKTTFINNKRKYP